MRTRKKPLLTQNPSHACRSYARINAAPRERGKQIVLRHCALCRLRREVVLAEQKDQAENVKRFIQQVKKYLYIDKLTPTILNDMVNAVYVHLPDKSSGKRVQEIEISYNYIGILPANLLYSVQNAKTA